MATALRRPAYRTLALLAVLAVLVGTVGAWGAGSAEATSYRYWSYWIGGGDGWSFSTQGAARRPADGTVDGWRFSISEASSSTTPPRREPSFARICGGTDPVAGSKRVGLVVDFGTTSDAPPGETPPALLARCVVVPEDANGYDVLSTSVTLRMQDGLICGMAGYPATECGAPVADPAPTDEPKDPEQSDEAGGGSSGGSTGGSASPTATSGGPGEGLEADSSRKDEQSKRKDDKADKQPDPALDEAPSGDASAVAAPVGPEVGVSGGEGSSTAVLVGVALIAAIGAAAWVVRRRRG